MELKLVLLLVMLDLTTSSNRTFMELKFPNWTAREKALPF